MWPAIGYALNGARAAGVLKNLLTYGGLAAGVGLAADSILSDDKQKALSQQSSQPQPQQQPQLSSSALDTRASAPSRERVGLLRPLNDAAAGQTQPTATWQQPQDALQQTPSYREAAFRMGAAPHTLIQQALAKSAMGQESAGMIAPRIERDPSYERTRQLVLDQIRNGLTTDVKGQRLTADGLHALVGTLQRLDESEQARYASQLDFGKNYLHVGSGIINQLTASQPQMNVTYRGAMKEFITPPETMTDMQAATQYQQQRLASWIDAARLPRTPNTMQQLQTQLGAARRMYELATTPQEKQRIGQELTRYSNLLTAYMLQNDLNPRVEQPQQYANGGVVSAPQLAAVQQYQAYAQLMQRIGLRPVPFEAFVRAAAQALPEMQPQATAAHQQAIGYADGGVVSKYLDPYQVDGKMVVDVSPDSGTDSIPAVIDETHPAKLDSGELVFPRDVVMYYGIERLTKMIEKARNGKQPSSTLR